MFSHYGGYASGQAYVDGLRPAVLIGAAFVAVGAVAALAIPSMRRAGATYSLDAEPLEGAPTGSQVPVYASNED